MGAEVAGETSRTELSRVCCSPTGKRDCWRQLQNGVNTVGRRELHGNLALLPFVRCLSYQLLSLLLLFKRLTFWISQE